jgi:hypothetical protein
MLYGVIKCRVKILSVQRLYGRKTQLMKKSLTKRLLKQTKATTTAVKNQKRNKMKQEVQKIKKLTINYKLIKLIELFAFHF